MAENAPPEDSPQELGLSPDAGEAMVDSAYQVLARKYRPGDFSALIGQEAMVRTLTNAFASGRIAHAFILTGIRGTGKTTTARILARCLNCTAADAPTITPCGECDSCKSINAGQHADVVEIDAASHTGVEKVRVLIDNARQRPGWGRYRVYVIDEVHMLSTSAFNALLKTLEEPPAHVKFVFATTEIRRVPVTVLSRCQRFDLRRVDPEAMGAHLGAIARAEGAEADADALALLTRAAEGSVRDGVSLLDQAISHDGPRITAAGVREMLGLADRSRILDLFEAICSGNAAGALEELQSQTDAGADPVAILEALAETCHHVSVLRVAPDVARDPGFAPEVARRGAAFAATLGPATLVRFWQMLERVLTETRDSSMPRLAADMAIIRLTHASTLPAPDRLVAELEPPGGSPGTPVTPAPAPASDPPPTAPAPAAAAQPHTLKELAALAHLHRNASLAMGLEHNVRLVELTPGKLVYAAERLQHPDRFRTDLAHALHRWTGQEWEARQVPDGGGLTLAEERERERTALRERVAEHPEVQKVMEAFPGTTIGRIRPLSGKALH